MPPKKDKKKKKGDKESKKGESKGEDGDKVTEIDKLLYEYQIKALDAKIKRVEDELNLATTKRDRSSKHVEEIQKEKKRVISFLNEKLRKKTDEAADLAEQLEGSKQEFDLTVRKYLTEIEDEENDHQEKQRVLNQEISQYNDEIKSLLHFREVREEIEAREKNLAEQVAAQRADFDIENKLLAKREAEDLLRLKKDMIRRVNIAASEFRAASDAQVAPTVKRALRENQQVKLALRKLESTRLDIEEQTNRFSTKLHEVNLKQKSLAEIELDLAHQSHAKAVIIGKLKKKLKEAHSTLKDLEEQEIVIEKKENILRELSGQIDHQDAEIVELEKQKDSLHETINSAALDLNSKKIDLAKIKDILHDCATDLLKRNHLTEDSLKSLQQYLNYTGSIDQKNISTPVEAIEKPAF